MADALVSQFVEMLASMAKAEVTMLFGAEDALQQLEKVVLAFSGVLQDAERRAFTDRPFRGWLADVKDLVYDADDIIDYSRTHAEKLARLSTEHPVLCYTPMLLFFRKIALRHRMGNSIRSVNVRLEGIRERKSDLNLIAAAAPRDDHRGSSSSSGNQRQTSPILFEPGIVGSGIEKDTSDLVGLLTREGELGGPTRIPVVAITGMGGVGKTTLAQKIYNHKTIKGCFREPPPMWVCISQQYSNEKLLKEIIRCAGGEDPGRDHETFAQLHCRLATVIKEKKIFLILDDVWAANVWENLLRDPLQTAAAAGSRVLITTRDERVAKQMGAIRLHPVRPLTDEQSWSLLCKLVFQGDGGSGDGGKVGDIGQQIAKKCDGLPLAIKTIAGVLMTKSRTRPAWEMVLTNPAWSLEELPDGVMGVLYLSYQDLPFQLKQCFIVCCLFPEDHVFSREQLTRLWVAEGFIAEKGGGDVLLEDVADDYYNELLSRSLLQPYYPKYANVDEGEYCKMHDLLRSLAQFLAGDEYSVGDSKQLINPTNTSSSMKLRHLSIVDKIMHHDVVTQVVVKERQSLRTLLLLDGMEEEEEDGTEHTDDTMDFLFSKLRCLRVIDFRDTKIKSLPKSVGNLLHLRYLNLSGSSSLVELPETVGNLSNLQDLSLSGCGNLKKLPRGIAKLYKLRALGLEGCFAVDGLPAGIGRLQHLNCLRGFVPNEEDNDLCSLEELSSLSQLRTLTIYKLERALPLIRGQPSSSRGFILKHLSHLRHLKLKCSYDYQPDGDDEKQKIQLIFEVDLFPPPSLETFTIDGYFGLEFPSWPMTNFPNLTKLEFLYCKYLEQLPALGQLPKLNELFISHADSVKSIRPEFMGMGMGMGVGAFAFPRMTTLKLERMSNLVEWQWEAEDGVVAAMPMPSLEELDIDNCPNLRCLPGGLGSVTTLTTLSIQGAHILSVIENLPSLKVLKVKWSDNLTRVSNLPALRDMKVTGCNALREVEDLYSLQRLGIYNIKMDSLPGWLLLKQGQPAFPMLKSLAIEVGYSEKEVLHRCLVDGPDWPKIQHYPQVDITYPYSPAVFVRYTKDPFTFTESNLDADGSAGDGGSATD